MARFLFSIFITVQLFSVSNLLYSNSSNSEPSVYCKSSIELVNSQSLDILIENLSDRKLVLLGESTHGTAEFYSWRAELSKRLIKEKGFNFIVVEGDWASIYKLNLYVKGLSKEFGTAREVLESFNRWPEWMWANTVIEDLANWLKDYNSSLSHEKMVGFYGMDVYGQWEAMDEVLRITKELMPKDFPKILEEYSCYTAYNFDEWQYARAVQRGYPSCFEGLNWVVEIIREHLESSVNPIDQKLLVHAKQSATVVKNSEDYYRLAVRDNITSWNSRVMHMHNTVGRLLEIHGSTSKGIVWAHNTHIGDARATSMGQEGMYNIGQLSRQMYTDKNVSLVGFTTYEGKVNAGSNWGASMSRMRIPEAQVGSAESLLNQCGVNNFYIIFDDKMKNSKQLLVPIGHRAIGVVYNPATERAYNYVPTILPLRYDVLFFIKSTSPLEPIIKR